MAATDGRSIEGALPKKGTNAYNTLYYFALTPHSMDDTHHKHKVPLRTPSPRLLPQAKRLEIPSRRPIHRHIPRRRPCGATKAWHPKTKDRIPVTLQDEGLHQ